MKNIKTFKIKPQWSSATIDTMVNDWLKEKNVRVFDLRIGEGRIVVVWEKHDSQRDGKGV